MKALTLQEIASLETSRTARSGRGFSMLRIAPAGWAALEGELDVLATLVSAHLRHTDFVERLAGREVGAVLIDAVGMEVQALLARVRVAVAMHFPNAQFLAGWASVGPGHQRTWQEAWRWAGTLLVADAAVPAAA
jgi:hypothetical protein